MRKPFEKSYIFGCFSVENLMSNKLCGENDKMKKEMDINKLPWHEATILKRRLEAGHVAWLEEIEASGGVILTDPVMVKEFKKAGYIAQKKTVHILFPGTPEASK